MDVLGNLAAQSLGAFVVYLVGLRSIRSLLRYGLRKPWGEPLIQLVLFVLLVGAFVLLTVPGLAAFQLIGVVLAVLLTTSLSALMSQQIQGASELREWFGNDADIVLAGVTHRSEITAPALRRLASILRSRGDVLTRSIRTSVTLSRCEGDPRFWNYDLEEESHYDVRGRTSVNLVWDVRPSWRFPVPFEASYPPLPLAYGEREDRFHVTSAPPLAARDAAFWENSMDNVDVEGWVIDPRERRRNRVVFEKRAVPFVESGGTHEVSSRFLRFSGVVPLSEDMPIVNVRVRRVPHPAEMPSMYFYAWDICTESWSFAVTLRDLGEVRIASLTPITSARDTHVPLAANRGDFAELQLRPLPGSALLPQDAVLVRMHRPAS